MLSIRRLLLMVLLLALLPACGIPPVNIETTTLSLNLTPGQRFRIKSTTEQHISSMFNFVRVDQEMLTINAYEVLDRSEDRYTLRLTYEYIEVLVRSNGEEQRVSSTDADASTKLGACVCALGGMTLTMTVGLDGTIYEVGDYDDAIDRLATVLEVEMTDYEREMVAEVLDELIANTFAKDRFLPFIPEEAVAVNDTWQSSGPLALAIPGTVTTTYTLKELTADQATVAASGDLNVDGTEGEAPEIYHYDLSGSQEGSIIVDRTTGLARSSEIHQTLKGTMLIETGGDEQSVRMTIEVDRTTEQLDPDAPLPTPRPAPTPDPDAVSELDELWGGEDEEYAEEPLPTELPPPPPPSDDDALALLRERSGEPLPEDTRISQRFDFEDSILLLLVAGPLDQPQLLGLATLEASDGEWMTWGVEEPDLLGLPGEPLIVADSYAYTSDLENETYTFHKVIYGQQPDLAVSSVEVRFSSGVPREAMITSPDRTFMVLSEYIEGEHAQSCSITSRDAAGGLIDEQLLEARWEAYVAEACGLPPQTAPPITHLSDAELLELIAEMLVTYDGEELAQDLQLTLLGRVDVPADEESYSGPYSILLLGDQLDDSWLGYATYEVRRGQPLVYEAYALDLERSATLRYAVAYAETYEQDSAEIAFGRVHNPLVNSVEVTYAEDDPRRAEVLPDGSWLIVGGYDTACWLQSYDVGGAMLERVQLYDEEHEWYVEACTGQPPAPPEITPTPGR